jgi:hypothetical protein
MPSELTDFLATHSPHSQPLMCYAGSQGYARLALCDALAAAVDFPRLSIAGLALWAMDLPSREVTFLHGGQKHVTMVARGSF